MSALVSGGLNSGLEARKEREMEEELLQRSGRGWGIERDEK